MMRYTPPRFLRLILHSGPYVTVQSEALFYLPIYIFVTFVVGVVLFYIGLVPRLDTHYGGVMIPRFRFTYWILHYEFYLTFTTPRNTVTFFVTVPFALEDAITFTLRADLLPSFHRCVASTAPRSHHSVLRSCYAFLIVHVSWVVFVRWVPFCLPGCRYTFSVSLFVSIPTDTFVIAVVLRYVLFSTTSVLPLFYTPTTVWSSLPITAFTTVRYVTGYPHVPPFLLYVTLLLFTPPPTHCTISGLGEFHSRLFTVYHYTRSCYITTFDFYTATYLPTYVCVTCSTCRYLFVPVHSFVGLDLRCVLRLLRLLCSACHRFVSVLGVMVRYCPVFYRPTTVLILLFYISGSTTFYTFVWSTGLRSVGPLSLHIYHSNHVSPTTVIIPFRLHHTEF